MSSVHYGPLFFNLFCLLLRNKHTLLITGASPDKYEMPTMRALLLTTGHLIQCVLAVWADGFSVSNCFEFAFAPSSTPFLCRRIIYL